MKSNRIVPTKETIEQELESDTRIKQLWLELNEDEVRFVCMARDFYNKRFIKELQKGLNKGLVSQMDIKLIDFNNYKVGFNKYFPSVNWFVAISYEDIVNTFEDKLGEIASLEVTIKKYDSNNWTRLCIELLTQGFHPKGLGQKNFWVFG